MPYGLPLHYSDSDGGNENITSGVENRIYVPGRGGSSGKIETFKVFESKKAIQDYLEESVKNWFSLLYTKMWLQSHEQQQILVLQFIQLKP